MIEMFQLQNTMALPRLKLTDSEKSAYKLLEMLDETRERRVESGEIVINVKTPVLKLFMDEAQKFSVQAFDNIKQYDRLYETHVEHCKEVTGLKIQGCRGQLLDNLKAFALSGTWSVVSQNYVNKEKKQFKIPIITTKDILEQLVWTRKNVRKMIVNKKLSSQDSGIQELIKAFQNFMVISQQEYMSEHPDAHDYNSSFNKVISLNELLKNSFKIHDKWEYFFTTDEKPNIDKLVDDIQSVLNYHKQLKNIDIRHENAVVGTNKLCVSSSTLAKGSVFVHREMDLALIQDIGEKTGDIESTTNFGNAASANIKEFENDIHTRDCINKLRGNREEDVEDKMRFIKRIKTYAGYDEDESSSGEEEESSGEEEESVKEDAPKTPCWEKNTNNDCLDEIPNI